MAIDEADIFGFIWRRVLKESRMETAFDEITLVLFQSRKKTNRQGNIECNHRFPGRGKLKGIELL